MVHWLLQGCSTPPEGLEHLFLALGSLKSFAYGCQTILIYFQLSIHLMMMGIPIDAYEEVSRRQHSGLRRK